MLQVGVVWFTGWGVSILTTYSRVYIMTRLNVFVGCKYEYFYNSVTFLMHPSLPMHALTL